MFVIQAFQIFWQALAVALMAAVFIFVVLFLAAGLKALAEGFLQAKKDLEGK